MITKLGVTVKILFDKYNKQLEGKIGTVERLYDYDKVGVKIEGCCNDRSSYGVYWFDEEFNSFAFELEGKSVRIRSLSYYCLDLPKLKNKTFLL